LLSKQAVSLHKIFSHTHTAGETPDCWNCSAMVIWNSLEYNYACEPV